MSFIKFCISVVFLVCALVSASFAATSSYYSPADADAAQETVDGYKALRKACSITAGDQRKVCFSQLREATKDYKAAQKVLAQYKRQDLRNVHLVTQAAQ